MRRAYKGAALLAIAAVSGGAVGCGGGDSPEKLTTHTYEVGVACEEGDKPFVPSTDSVEGGSWADVDIACTDGSSTSRPLAVTEDVKQGTVDGFVTAKVKSRDEVEMDIEDSNIRVSAEPHAGADGEMTVRKLAFNNVESLGSIAVTEEHVPINP